MGSHGTGVSAEPSSTVKMVHEERNRKGGVLALKPIGEEGHAVIPKLLEEHEAHQVQRG